eukprot:980129-Alexandrium_andersonii.AAC.1
MSASLVGSEMCIRDRYLTTVFCARGPVVPWKSAGDRQRVPNGRSSTEKPVSYTHLTLPTICSV